LFNCLNTTTPQPVNAELQLLSTLGSLHLSFVHYLNISTPQPVNAELKFLLLILDSPLDTLHFALSVIMIKKWIFSKTVPNKIFGLNDKHWTNIHGKLHLSTFTGVINNAVYSTFNFVDKIMA
jgi:hypothetical protein